MKYVITKCKKKSLLGWTHIDFKPNNMLVSRQRTNYLNDMYIEERIFQSKKKALAYFNCYDNEIYRVRITIEEV